MIGLIFLSALLISGWYLYHWEAFFNSDFAMIGLLGKRVLERGEQFLFVPSVGYQGMLIEGNLSAALFRLFGVNAPVLHLTAVILFFVFLGVFYFSVKAWFSKKEASLAAVLVCFSSPLFFGNVLRTQPNYPETYTLGCILFWLYRRLLQAPKTAYVCGAGLVTGFGFYLYGQIIYFVAAITTSFLISKNKELFKLPKSMIGLCLVFVFAPTLSIKEVRIPGFTVALVLCVGYCLRELYRWRKEIRNWAVSQRKPISLFVLFFLAGYSPSLYHRVVLNEPTKSGFAFIKFSEELHRNINLFIEALPVFSAGVSPEILPQLLTLFFLILTLFYLLRDLAEGESRVPNPFWLLGAIVLIATISSRSVYNPFSLRYTLCWQLVVAIALAKLFFYIKEKRALRASLFLTLILSYKTYALIISPSQYHYYTEQLARWDDIKPVVTFLKVRQVDRGYGDYWVSYMINFMTNEEVKIEPLYSSYLPFYREAVRATHRIALIKSGPSTWYEPQIIESSPIVRIQDQDYEVQESKRFEPWTVWILEKKGPSVLR